MGLPKPVGYKYFYFNEDFKYIEITEEEYEAWDTSGYWVSIPK